MRELDVKKITEAVAKCCMDSCYYLPERVLAKLKANQKTEVSPLGRQVLGTIIENAELARKKAVPLCQDTWLTVVFIDIGQEVHFTGGALEEAPDEADVPHPTQEGRADAEGDDDGGVPDAELLHMSTLG